MIPRFLERVRCQPHLANLHREAFAHSRHGGLVCEFGVGFGTSLAMLREIVPRQQTIYGFDSFQGLPEVWNGNPVGAFRSAAITTLPNVMLVEGWFADTLPVFAKHHAGMFVSFAHIDCDLYSSTTTVLACMNPLIVNGTVIVFDELFGYDDWRNHEYLALVEWADRAGRQFDYLVRDEYQRAAVMVTK